MATGPSPRSLLLLFIIRVFPCSSGRAAKDGAVGGRWEHWERKSFQVGRTMERMSFSPLNREAGGFRHRLSEGLMGRGRRWVRLVSSLLYTCLLHPPLPPSHCPFWCLQLGPPPSPLQLHRLDLSSSATQRGLFLQPYPHLPTLRGPRSPAQVEAAQRFK